MWKKVFSIITAVVLIGSIAPAYIWFDSTYARADNVKQNTIEIQKQRLMNDIRWYEDRQQQVMDRCNVRSKAALPSHAYQRYVEYERKIKELERELQLLMNKR